LGREVKRVMGKWGGEREVEGKEKKKKKKEVEYSSFDG